jgi:hypothetical protein
VSNNQTPRAGADLRAVTDADIAAWTTIAEIWRDNPSAITPYAASGFATRFLEIVDTLLRRLDAERGELKRIAKYADIPVVASEPLETCCFCNQPIEIGQAYDRLDAGRYCHLGCWFAERRKELES